MSIVSSKITEDSRQKSGRRVSYEFITHTGAGYNVTKYMPIDGDTDTDTDLLIEKAKLDDRLQRKEFPKLLHRIDGGEQPLSIIPEYNTIEDFHTYLLKKMATADGDTALKYASMEGIFTDEQVSIALGITLQAVAEWRLKVQTLANASETIKVYQSGMNFENI